MQSTNKIVKTYWIKNITKEFFWNNYKKNTEIEIGIDSFTYLLNTNIIPKEF